MPAMKLALLLVMADIIIGFLLNVQVVYPSVPIGYQGSPFIGYALGLICLVQLIETIILTYEKGYSHSWIFINGITGVVLLLVLWLCAVLFVLPFLSFL